MAKARKDAAGFPKVEPTVLERLAIEALNEVKAWRDSDGNEGFPHATREKIEAILMTYEQRRTPLGQVGDPCVALCRECKADGICMKRNPAHAATSTGTKNK